MPLSKEQKRLLKQYIDDEAIECNNTSETDSITTEENLYSDTCSMSDEQESKTMVLQQTQDSVSEGESMQEQSPHPLDQSDADSSVGVNMNRRKKRVKINTEDDCEEEGQAQKSNNSSCEETIQTAFNFHHDCIVTLPNITTPLQFIVKPCQKLQDLPMNSGYFVGGTIVILNNEVAIGPENTMIQNPCRLIDGDYKLKVHGPYRKLSQDFYIGYVDTSEGRLLINLERAMEHKIHLKKEEWSEESTQKWYEKGGDYLGYGFIKTHEGGWKEFNTYKPVESLPSSLSVARIAEWTATRPSAKGTAYYPPRSSITNESYDSPQMNGISSLHRENSPAQSVQKNYSAAPGFNPVQLHDDDERKPAALDNPTSPTGRIPTVTPQRPYNPYSRSTARSNPYSKGGLSGSPTQSPFQTNQHDRYAGNGYETTSMPPRDLHNDFNNAYLPSQMKNDSSTNHQQERIRRPSFNVHREAVQNIHADFIPTNQMQNVSHEPQVRMSNDRDKWHVSLFIEYLDGYYAALHMRIRNHMDSPFSLHLEHACDNKLGLFRDPAYRLYPADVCKIENTDDALMNETSTSKNGFIGNRKVFVIHLYQGHPLLNDNNIRNYLVRIANFLNNHRWKSASEPCEFGKNMTKYSVPLDNYIITQEPIRKLGSLVLVTQAINILANIHNMNAILAGTLQNRMSFVRKYFKHPYSDTIECHYGLPFPA